MRYLEENDLTMRYLTDKESLVVVKNSSVNDGKFEGYTWNDLVAVKVDDIASKRPFDVKKEE